MKPLMQLVSLMVLTLLADVCPAAPKAAKPKNGPLGMKFVSLPKGTFYMGGGGGKVGRKKEIKAGFEIAIHEVTQAQWKSIMGTNPSFLALSGEGKEKAKGLKEEDLKHHPVERVSWNDVQEFIKKLNEKEKGNGYVYRLPSEAEWEYACREGATTKSECSYDFYLAKPTNDLSSKYANFNGKYPYRKGPKGPDLHRTTKVGSYQPNRIGLYDMHGNVLEWCNDKASLSVDSVPVLRGGCWLFSGDSCKASSRTGYTAGFRYYLCGFRLARVPVR